MGNGKEIKVRAVLDSSGFDQQVKQMQDRITQITRQASVMQTAGSQYGKGSGMSKLSQSFFGDFNKSSVGELREEFNLNVRQMQSQSRNMKEKEREMTKLAKLEEKMTLAQRDRVKLLGDEIKGIKEKGRALIEENNKISSLARGLGVQDMAGAGFKGTGVAPQGQQGLFGRMSSGVSNIMSQMGGGSVLAGVGTLASRVGGVGLAGMRVAGDYIDYQRTRDRTLAKNIGQSVQAGNLGFDSIMQKKGFMNSYENPERQAAMQMAMGERERSLTLNPLRAGGKVAMAAAGGAAAGSFFGGPIGSAIGGAAAGGAAFLSGGAKSGFAQMFDKDAYNAAINTETLGNFRSNLTAMKMANPEKFAAGNMFSQRRGGMQNLQRQLNMSDQGLLGDAVTSEKLDIGKLTNREYGATPFGTALAEEESRIANQNVGKKEGFLTRSTRDRSGAFSFTEERIKNNINSIFAAGGTSDFVTQQMGGTMAAEYQRGGMANAARQLGGISGTGNLDGAGTEEQYKKFISEAMRIGLDSSELAKDTTTANEETRRAMEAITNVYTKSGGAEGAVDVFASGMMGGAGAEIAGAQSAFNIRNKESGQASGYRGALKYAFLNSEKGRNLFTNQKTGKKLDDSYINTLAGYNVNNLDKDDVVIKEAATRLGKTPEEVMDAVRQTQSASENYSAEADSARSKLKGGYEKYLKDNGLKDSAVNKKAFQATAEGQSLVADSFVGSAQERTEGFSQQTAQTKSSYAFGGFQVDKELRGGTPGLDIGGRGAMDAGEGSEASDQATALQVLNRNLPGLVKAAEENRTANIGTKLNTFNMSQKLDDLVEFMKDGGTDPSGKVLEELQKSIDGGQQPNYGNKKSR